MPIVIHTGPADRAAPFVDAMRGAGFEVRAIPAIESRPVEPSPSELDAVRAHAPFAVVVVTSPRTAEALGRLSPWVANADVAAIGPATAEACIQAGFPPKWTGGGAARTFLGALAARVGFSGKSVLFPRGDLARDPVLSDLAGCGARVVSPVMYRTAPVAHPPEVLRAAVAGAGGVTFTSPSGVRSFAAASEAAGVLPAARNLFAATLGTATESAAQKAGFLWRGVCRRPGPQPLAALLTTALET